MKEALYGVTPLHCFAGLSLSNDRMRVDGALLDFCDQLEIGALAPGLRMAINAYVTDEGLLFRQRSVVVTTNIHAPSWIENNDKHARELEMDRTRKS